MSGLSSSFGGIISRLGRLKVYIWTSFFDSSSALLESINSMGIFKNFFGWVYSIWVLSFYSIEAKLLIVKQLLWSSIELDLFWLSNFKARDELGLTSIWSDLYFWSNIFCDLITIFDLIFISEWFSILINSSLYQNTIKQVWLTFKI